MAQIMTLCEFMAFLTGNEPVIGLLLANCLLLIGSGSYLYGFADRLSRRARFLIELQATVGLVSFL